MQPPDAIPSITALYDAVETASVSYTLPSSIMTTTTSLLFSIATAAATAGQDFTIPQGVGIPSLATSPSDSDDESSGECKLLGPFAILVQTALGVLALSSLVFKRWRERPQRPLKVWSFDVSKQVVGSILLHLANLLMSMISSGQFDDLAKAAATTLMADASVDYQPNPCSFYLLNLAIDTTLGIPILICTLKVLTIGASYTPLAIPPESIESGHYGTPPKAGWWLKQCLIYFVGLLGMKACVFLIFHLCPWLGRVGDWALRWTEGNEALQIAFVMLIFPLIMNALQYYIIDTFIKDNKKEADSDEQAEHGEAEEHGGLLAEEVEGSGSSIDADEDKASTTKPKLQSKIDHTEPDKDASAVRIDGSSSLLEHAEEEGIEHRPRI
ncbi:vacuolar membrane protein-domain-containing protein [Exophiala viscosa]|uniref:Vacuolar membrane protein-domain-containing protein n=1 Tax=Exophiala viscosa TaxID=2486360 RepID=A0AAN6DPC9_9EURO|nr:vacuolar membrane protein-domain-containing protein [Exophiala viscosa]